MNNHLKAILLYLLISSVLLSCSSESPKETLEESFEVNLVLEDLSLDDLNLQFNQTTEFAYNISGTISTELKISVLEAPTLGTVDINTANQVFTYTPNGDFGQESFVLLFEGSSISVEKAVTFQLLDLSPILNFSDLISGPSTGLDDGKGSGVIVTLWGQKLGNTQGDAIIEICDDQNECQPPAHVYYWKDADGTLPSGPANLYKSHRMQEIAISIPEVTNGEKIIRLSNKFGVTDLPFLVREGAVYHVMATGDDETGDGSFTSPWQTLEKADSKANAGSTIYIHNLLVGGETVDQAIYVNRVDAMSSLENQFSYVTYPNNRVEVLGHRGFSVYSGSNDITAGFVVSKLSFFVANANEDADGQPVDKRASLTFAIFGNRDGRAVGNYITDTHSSDLNGGCPDSQQAAIVASSISTDRVSNFKVYGNHIHEYGCKGTSRFHHTTYFTIRSGAENEQLRAPEASWNFLEDNLAVYGIHYFDENHSGEDCGQFVDTFKVYNNVIVNQGGAALSFGAVCPVSTRFEFINNIAINSGLSADYSPDKIQGSSDTAVNIAVQHEDVEATLVYSNNLFYGWSGDDLSVFDSCIGLKASHQNASILWDNNICYTDQDLDFIKSNYLGNGMENQFSGENNVWFSAAAHTDTTIPDWSDTNILDTPLIEIVDYHVTIDPGSPLIGKGTSPLERDIYGNIRPEKTTIGPVEFQKE